MYIECVLQVFSMLYMLAILHFSFRIYYMNSRFRLRLCTRLRALAQMNGESVSAFCERVRWFLHVVHWDAKAPGGLFRKVHLCVLYPFRFALLAIGNFFNWTLYGTLLGDCTWKLTWRLTF